MNHFVNAIAIMIAQFSVISVSAANQKALSAIYQAGQATMTGQLDQPGTWRLLARLASQWNSNEEMQQEVAAECTSLLTGEAAHTVQIYGCLTMLDDRRFKAVWVKAVAYAVTKYLIPLAQGVGYNQWGALAQFIHQPTGSAKILAQINWESEEGIRIIKETCLYTKQFMAQNPATTDQQQQQYYHLFNLVCDHIADFYGN